MGAGKSTLGGRARGAAGAAVRRRRRRDRARGADRADLRDGRRGCVPAARVEARARGARRDDAGRDRARRRRGRHRPDPEGMRDRALTVLVEIDAEEAWRRVAGREAARAGRGGVPNAVRPAAAALRRCGGRAGCGSRRRRPRCRRGPRRARRAGTARRARPGRGTGRDRQRRASGGDLRHGRPARARRTRPRRPRARARRAGENGRVAGGALACAAARAVGHARRARRRLHDGRRRLRCGHVLPRDRLGRRADDARRPGRRGDRGQDRHRPPRREEPRRRLPLARPDGDRPVTLETLPEEELANGRAEVVKTGLLAGEPIWELPPGEQVRRAAAFKTALCLRDPHDRGQRAQLNLGHTFAHALEAAADYALPHGRAVALGLLAALRLSGLDTTVVEETLRPEPVRVDRDAAWAALARDKKVVDGTPRLVLLEAPGRPRVGVEVPSADVRGALDALIAG